MDKQPACICCPLLIRSTGEEEEFSSLGAARAAAGPNDTVAVSHNCACPVHERRNAVYTHQLSGTVPQ